MGGEIQGDVLSLARPLHQRAGLLLPVAEPLDDVQLLFEMAALARELLAPRLVRPYVRVGELLIYFGE